MPTRLFRGLETCRGHTTAEGQEGPRSRSANSRILLAGLRRIRFCLLMSRRYRPWKIEEPMLLPARGQEFVDKDHLARFVLSLMVEEIDLADIERAYRVNRGQPPFDPAMMTAL